jgi:hypothetical protein
MRYREAEGEVESRQQEIPGQQAEQNTARIDQRLVWVLSIACAMSVANLYYCQPLLADIGRSFAASESAIGFIATLTQLGYALGLLLIVPLGDAFERRNLITLTLLPSPLLPLNKPKHSKSNCLNRPEDEPSLSAKSVINFQKVGFQVETFSSCLGYTLAQ